jgi:hypothetical protein
MLDLWDPVNQCSSMIIVIGGYPIIPLEMSIKIVYGPLTDSPMCDIVWKMCTRKRWDPDQPYGIIMKRCHTWPICEHMYVVLVKFIPLCSLAVESIEFQSSIELNSN